MEYCIKKRNNNNFDKKYKISPETVPEFVGGTPALAHQ